LRVLEQNGLLSDLPRPYCDALIITKSRLQARGEQSIALHIFLCYNCVEQSV